MRIAAVRTAAGFTLMEIMVVLGLVALLVAVGVGGLSKSVESAKIRGAARDLAAALRYTRGQALASGRQQAFELDLEKRSYQAPNKPAVALPESMSLKFLTAEEELTSSHSGRVRFFPDGSSSGGRIRVLGAAHEWDIEIAWLTGAIRVDENALQP
jgi:general secretion pathway protein H